MKNGSKFGLFFLLAAVLAQPFAVQQTFGSLLDDEDVSYSMTAFGKGPSTAVAKARAHAAMAESIEALTKEHGKAPGSVTIIMEGPVSSHYYAIDFEVTFTADD